MSNDSLKNIIGVALGVCLVCSILVSTAAVVLKPRQVANQILEKRKNVLIAGDLMKKGETVDVDVIFSEKIQPVLIELQTGERLPEEKMTGSLAPETFDVKKVSKEPATSRLLPSDKDLARIRRVPLYTMIYFVKANDGYSRIIFPVHGSGLWSIMYGFVALDQDLQTISGFTVYEHGETPGLGGEIENPTWQTAWKGKIAFDDQGNLKLKVLKGKAAPDSTSEIDGLSGATLTTRGVDNTINFWFGPDGYGPFLEKLSRRQGDKETRKQG
ncbi:MAG: Na(+)-translocating NADH-quinone reductase subunit C [Candidatus Aminicenantes bacterium]|nr:MAG: Na(+)-translocating NADH-quinone reductase subunit C [Candidatus Aminicenantes bacterium]